MIAAVILIGFSVLTYQRNKVWKAEALLWEDTIQKSPSKPRPYNNGGMFYAHKGDLTQAIADFNKAIELDPDYAEGYNNRGFAYDQQGR